MPRSKHTKTSPEAETPYAKIPAYRKRKAPTGLAKRSPKEIDDLLSKEEIALEAQKHLGKVDQDKSARTRAGTKTWESLSSVDERVKYAKQHSTLSQDEKAFMKRALREEGAALNSKAKLDKARRERESDAYESAKKQHLLDGGSAADFDSIPMGRASAIEYKAMMDAEAKVRKDAREQARQEQHDETSRTETASQPSITIEEVPELRRKSSRSKQQPNRLPITFTTAKSYEEPEKHTGDYLTPQVANYIEVRWGPDWYTGTVLNVFPIPENPDKKRMLVYYDSDNTWFFHDLPLQLGNEWRFSLTAPDIMVKEFIDPDDEGTYRVNYETAEVKFWPAGASPPPLTDNSSNTSTPSPKLG